MGEWGKTGLLDTKNRTKIDIRYNREDGCGGGSGDGGEEDRNIQ